MNPEQMLTWLSIVAGVGGAAMTYGLLRGRVDEQERRIVVLETRTKETDEALHAAVNTMTQIDGKINTLTELVRALRPQRRGSVND
jgi:RNA processing factor Prp31